VPLLDALARRAGTVTSTGGGLAVLPALGPLAHRRVALLDLKTDDLQLLTVPR